MSKTLIRGGTIVSMDPKIGDLPQGDVLIDGEGYRPKALKPVPGAAAPADAPAQEKEKGYEF